ncbi:MAG: ectoine hydroxylase-related dioxygenase (phytanoyl-CoA dioxygenase family), partial [Candidatus Azotimanducaceae bacterium]
MPMINDYEVNGYLVLKDIFDVDELQRLRDVVVQFHQSWKRENSRFYAEEAINSASLTAKGHLKDVEREA